MAYFEHTRFYIDNISRGIYPMWESTRQLGVPAEFFMRRIGSYNPAYFFIIVLNKLGMPYVNSYLLFLAGYYFLGVLGFYLLAKQMFKDSNIAFLAYILLLFSSLGTKAFESYILLVSVPTIWFFFFLFAFTQKQNKFHFLGIIFSLMIILITYIPFYFITVFCPFF
ncbi:MAG: hypothetical protein P9X22_05995 [Candidatus Zapsychrus exili]|nr:hypothetical protein [Candidatus Zapsychrus exili]